MNFKKTLLISALSLFAASTSLAAVVTTVKGKKALIDLEGDTSEAGDEFFLIDPSTTKKTAIIRIVQVKGHKALGEVLKGRALPGYTLQAKGSSSRPMSADVTDPSAPMERSYRGGGGRYLTMLKESYGVTGAYIMNSMTAEVSYRDSLNALQRTTASMSGTGFSIGGFYDYPFGDSLAGRAFAGIEQFNVTGNVSAAACSQSTTCDAKINYLSLYGLGKWYFLPGQYRSWVGAGAGFMLALSKSSTALNESQISTNQTITLAIGTDVQMSRQNYVSVSIEYNMFPDSSTVKASMILLKAGWAWNL